MSTYRVVLKDKTEFKVKADDVDTDYVDDCSSHPHYISFLASLDGGDFEVDGEHITVALVPYDLVAYVVKESL